MSIDPNLFGAPRTGVHAYRLFDIAVVDVAFTVAAAVSLSRYTGTPMPTALALLVVAGIAAHAIVGVPTSLNTRLFTS